MGLYLGGLIIGRIFASEIGGGGGAYFREGLFLGELIIGILRLSMSGAIQTTDQSRQAPQSAVDTLQKDDLYRGPQILNSFLSE